MIMKLLLVARVIAIVYFFFITKKPTIKNSDEDNNSQKNEIKSNDMVKCSTCKIYCEIRESILSNSKYYCSNECLEKS